MRPMRGGPWGSTWPALFVAALGLALVGCAASTSESSGAPATEPDASSDGAGVLFDGDLPEGSFDDRSSCAGDSRSGSKTPLDMYIMLDQSGSMGSTVGTGSQT